MSYSSQIDLSKLTKRNYEKIFLKRNPFPSTAIPEDLPQVTVDRDNIIRHFQSVISSLYQDSSSSITVLVGGYGSGKSHLLKIFKFNIFSQLYDLTPATLPIYIKSPGTSFLDFFIAMIDDIGKEKIELVSKRLIKKYINNNLNEVTKHFIKGSIKKEDNILNMDINEIFKKSIIIDFANDFIRYYNPIIKNTELLAALFFVSHPSYNIYAWRWFNGEKLTSEERKVILVSGEIEHHRTAYTLIKPVMLCFKEADMKNLVFLIDELEKILLLSANYRSQYQDDLRHLIDDNPQNLCMFFSITPPEWRKISEQPSAFTRRLEGNIFTLDDFDKERIILLIKGYLHYSRIDGYKDEMFKKVISDEKIKESIDYEIYPFSYNAIDSITKQTGRLSSIILLCRNVLDYYLDKREIYNVINEALIKEYLIGG